MKLEINGTDGLPEAAEKLLDNFRHERVFAFYGKMGAGKTTFIKILCDTLEVMDVVTSPTFALINEYLTEQGESVFHFDFYRIEKVSEAVDIGFEEYIYSGNYCLIEWPEKVEGLLPKRHVRVVLTEKEDGIRKLEAELTV
ncbi:MAG: tRNA (adenosine(37)-N6)-threonylcarbamoyltransferase complex ATPase subunit type 1 TsaE [Bacteroidota bacterium]